MTEDRAPRYQQLAETLQDRIGAGLYPLGTLLPTEAELCAEFDVSRHTVREALRRLTEAGLLNRRQGSGSQVVATAAPRAFVHEMRSLDGLFQYAADTVFRIDRIALAPPEPEDQGDLPAAPDWLVVAGLRIDPGAGTALCTSTVYIARTFADIADTLKTHKGAITPLIEARHGVAVADVEQTITARPMPTASARALGLGRKDWAVRVVRRYFDTGGRLIVASVNHHPAERFSYTMHLRREERGV
jgi:GntR family transcriptional regulator